jgi:hypothetical protein
MESPESVARKVIENALFPSEKIKCIETWRDYILLDRGGIYKPPPAVDTKVWGMIAELSFFNYCEFLVNNPQHMKDKLFEKFQTRDIKQFKYEVVEKDTDRAVVKITYKGKLFDNARLIKADKKWKFIMDGRILQPYR